MIYVYCIGFVMWQCSGFVEKYIADPQATSLGYAKNEQFPSITICNNVKTKQFNEKRLKECGINRYNFDPIDKFCNSP